MARSNAAEAMPKPEPEKEEEILDMTDEAELVEEGKSKDKKKAKETKKKKPTEKEKFEAAHKHMRRKKHERMQMATRDEEISELQGRFDEMMKKALDGREGTPLGEQMKKALLNSPEAKRLRELMEEKEGGLDLESLVDKTLEDIKKKKEAPVELEAEDLEEIPADPLEGDAKTRVAYANMLKIPNFDHTSYNALLVEKEKQEKNLAAIESGEAKVGWFAKRRMKKRLKQILKKLKPLEDELVTGVLDLKKGPPPEAKAPAPEVGIEKPMEHGLIEDMDYHQRIEAANKLQKEIDETEKVSTKDSSETKKKRKELKELLKAIEADEKRLGKKTSKKRRKK